MKKPFLIALAVAVAPFAVQAETYNIYGWQNHSWEFVDIDGGRNFDRIQSNAGNIGFSASVDTGMSGIKVNFQCEQFTYFNHFAGGTGWCNRNSKIGLRHPELGEIMFATWLLPYNEGVAQWVDPFYDAGADSHTSIMGSVGANTIFYNTGDFDFQASASGPSTGFSGSEFNYAGAGYDTGFNRRQENIIQYWSPNWNGVVFRFAWTAGNRDETTAPRGGGEIDPMIRSGSLAYSSTTKVDGHSTVWLAATWQDHEDWTAVSVGEMASSDAESWRFAGRYIVDLGGGMSFQISAMYEDLEYEFNGVSSLAAAVSAFGYNADNFMSSYNRNVIADTNSNAFRVQTDVNDGSACIRTGVSIDAQRCDIGANDGEMDVKHVKDAEFIMENGGEQNVANLLNRIGTMEHNTGDSVTIEREAWLISSKIKFGGRLDLRFSYMDADDLEVSCNICAGDWQETAADAWNVGLFYTMPAGTELRLTYSEVDNDNNGSYGQGISGTGLGVPGGEIEMFALGIVQWFD